jgi:sporulation protein YlmC with PRC-barrel domain
MTKKLALAAMAAALLSTTVLAQSSPPAPAAKNPVAAQSSAQGKWRASKLIGLNVYNAQNEKIGDINELMADSSGKIDLVVIGVGGFLGMGEHRVGLPLSQVKFVNEPMKTSSTTSTPQQRTTGSGTATTTTTTTTSSAARDYPDHATVNMSKDQLKALPAFKYASDTSSSTTTTSPAPANRAPANPPANQPPNPPAGQSR